MSTEIAKAGGAPAPGLFEDHDAALVDQFVEAIDAERGFDALPRLPTPAERARIANRAAALRRKLTPTNLSMTQQDDLAEKLGELWNCFPSMRNADVGAMTSAYIEDLGRLPLFAALAAIEDVRHRRIKSLDPDWPPTSPRCVDQGEKHVEPFERERMRAERVLRVTKIAVKDDPSMREKIAEHVSAFVKTNRERQKDAEEQLRADVFNSHGLREAADRNQREEYEHHGLEPPQGTWPISMSLAKNLGMVLKRGRGGRK